MMDGHTLLAWSNLFHFFFRISPPFFPSTLRKKKRHCYRRQTPPTNSSRIPLSRKYHTTITHPLSAAPHLPSIYPIFIQLNDTPTSHSHTSRLFFFHFSCTVFKFQFSTDSTLLFIFLSCTTTTHRLLSFLYAVLTCLPAAPYVRCVCMYVSR